MINAAADEASTDEASTDEASEAALTDETTKEEDDTSETSETEETALGRPEETINHTGHPNPTLAIPDVTLSRPTDPPEQATTTEEGERGEITGVGQPGGNTGVGTAPVLECTGVGTTQTATA